MTPDEYEQVCLEILYQDFLIFITIMYRRVEAKRVSTWSPSLQTMAL